MRTSVAASAPTGSVAIAAIKIAANNSILRSVLIGRLLAVTLHKRQNGTEQTASGVLSVRPPFRRTRRKCRPSNRLRAISLRRDNHGPCRQAQSGSLPDPSRRLAAGRRDSGDGTDQGRDRAASRYFPPAPL